jgi:hypothetical protein
LVETIGRLMLKRTGSSSGAIPGPSSSTKKPPFGSSPGPDRGVRVEAIVRQLLEDEAAELAGRNAGTLLQALDGPE